VECSTLGFMKKRLLISCIVLAALLLALYGVMFGTGAK
jgi:predicted small secreted protein